MNALKGFQSVIEHFTQRKWNFRVDDPQPILRASFNMRHASIGIVAVVNPEDDLLQVVSFLPVVIPPVKRQAVAELCVRASWGFKLGRFDFNLDTGELRFHTSLPYRKGELADDLIGRVIGTNLATADTFFPAFMAVLYAGRSPAEAVSRIQHPPPKSTAEARPTEPLPPPRIAFN
jgi:hypothetical protein